MGEHIKIKKKKKNKDKQVDKVTSIDDLIQGGSGGTGNQGVHRGSSRTFRKHDIFSTTADGNLDVFGDDSKKHAEADPENMEDDDHLHQRSILYNIISQNDDSSLSLQQDIERNQVHIDTQHLLARENVEPYSVRTNDTSVMSNVSGISHMQFSFEFCRKCKIYMPKYTYHCKKCDVCVQKLDHHCKILGCCIGIRNYRFFLYYLAFTMLSDVYMGVFSYMLLVSLVRSRKADSAQFWTSAFTAEDLKDFLNTCLELNPGYPLLCLWLLLVFSALFPFLCFHLYQLKMGRTSLMTWQLIKGEVRVDDLPKVGLRENCYQVFCKKRPSSRPGMYTYTHLPVYTRGDLEDSPSTSGG